MIISSVVEMTVSLSAFPFVYFLLREPAVIRPSTLLQKPCPCFYQALTAQEIFYARP